MARNAVTVLEKFALRHPPAFVSPDHFDPDAADGEGLEFSLEMFGGGDLLDQEKRPAKTPAFRTSTPGGMHERRWGQSTKWSPQKKFSSARLRALADTATHSSIFQGATGPTVARPLPSEAPEQQAYLLAAHPESPSPTTARGGAARRSKARRRREAGANSLLGNEGVQLGVRGKAEDDAAPGTRAPPPSMSSTMPFLADADRSGGVLVVGLQQHAAGLTRAIDERARQLTQAFAQILREQTRAREIHRQRPRRRKPHQGGGGSRGGSPRSSRPPSGLSHDTERDLDTVRAYFPQYTGMVAGHPVPAGERDDGDGARPSTASAVDISVLQLQLGQVQAANRRLNEMLAGYEDRAHALQARLGHAQVELRLQGAKRDFVEYLGGGYTSARATNQLDAIDEDEAKRAAEEERKRGMVSLLQKLGDGGNAGDRSRQAAADRQLAYAPHRPPRTQMHGAVPKSLKKQQQQRRGQPQPQAMSPRVRAAELRRPSAAAAVASSATVFADDELGPVSPRTPAAAAAAEAKAPSSAGRSGGGGARTPRVASRGASASSARSAASAASAASSGRTLLTAGSGRVSTKQSSRGSSRRTGRGSASAGGDGGGGGGGDRDVPSPWPSDVSTPPLTPQDTGTPRGRRQKPKEEGKGDGAKAAAETRTAADNTSPPAKAMLEAVSKQSNAAAKPGHRKAVPKALGAGSTAERKKKEKKEAKEPRKPAPQRQKRKAPRRKEEGDVDDLVEDIVGGDDSDEEFERTTAEDRKLLILGMKTSYTSKIKPFQNADDEDSDGKKEGEGKALARETKALQHYVRELDQLQMAAAFREEILRTEQRNAKAKLAQYRGVTRRKRKEQADHLSRCNRLSEELARAKKTAGAELAASVLQSQLRELEREAQSRDQELATLKKIQARETWTVARLEGRVKASVSIRQRQGDDIERLRAALRDVSREAMSKDVSQFLDARKRLQSLTVFAAGMEDQELAREIAEAAMMQDVFAGVTANDGAGAGGGGGTGGGGGGGGGKGGRKAAAAGRSGRKKKGGGGHRAAREIEVRALTAEEEEEASLLGDYVRWTGVDPATCEPEQRLHLRMMAHQEENGIPHSILSMMAERSALAALMWTYGGAAQAKAKLDAFEDEIAAERQRRANVVSKLQASFARRERRLVEALKSVGKHVLEATLLIGGDGGGGAGGAGGGAGKGVDLDPVRRRLQRASQLLGMVTSGEDADADGLPDELLFHSDGESTSRATTATSEVPSSAGGGID